MSGQQSSEPWYVWVFRQVVTQPAAVMAIIGWFAAGTLYMDMREFIASSTSALQTLTETIKLNNQEQKMLLQEVIQNTRELEYWHKQDATKNEKRD